MSFDAGETRVKRFAKRLQTLMLSHYPS